MLRRRQLWLLVALIVPPLPLLDTRAQSATSVALGYYQVALPTDLSGLGGYEAATGQPAAIISWYAIWGGWKSVLDAQDLAAASAHGAVPMITWEPWAGQSNAPEWSLQNAILSGAHDAYIDSWARGLAAFHGRVLLRFAHEMHDQPVYPWSVGVNGNTAADYVAAWRHVRAIFARYDTSNVEWIWNPNTLGDAPEAAYIQKYAAAYPGDDQVDWVGLDIFNTGPDVDWGAPRWRTFGDILQAPYAALETLTDKPLILAEVGSAEHGGSKGEWIMDALSNELDAFPRVVALVWFDVDKESTWSLHSSDASVAAWDAAARLRAQRRS